MFSPVVLFVYNRPNHTRQTIDSLKLNYLAKESDLFVFSDAAKDIDSINGVNEVRTLIHKIEGFKSVTIVCRETNFGLSNSIIDGVTSIINKYGRVIVLEDDLITSPYFLSYMNKYLDLYRNDNNIASIHGYVYPIENLKNTFFLRGADCWGWATWKRAWRFFEPDGKILLKNLISLNLENEANFNNTYNFSQMLRDQINGKNDSWAIRWYMSAFLNNMLTLYPGKSFVQNIGFDEFGTHFKSSTKVYNVELNTILNIEKIKLEEDLNARHLFEVYFKKIKPSFIAKIKRILTSKFL